MSHHTNNRYTHFFFFFFFSHRWRIRYYAWIWHHKPKRHAAGNGFFSLLVYDAGVSHYSIPLWSQGHIWMPGFSAARSGRGADLSCPHYPTCGPSLCRCTSLRTQLLSNWTCRHPRRSSSDPPGRLCSGSPQWSTWRSYAERRPEKKTRADKEKQTERKERMSGNSYCEIEWNCFEFKGKLNNIQD